MFDKIEQYEPDRQPPATVLKTILGIRALIGDKGGDPDQLLKAYRASLTE